MKRFWGNLGGDVGTRLPAQRNAPIQQLFGFLERRSRLFVLGLGVCLTAVLGVADYATGFEVSLVLFYILPVSLVAWLAGQTSGLVMSWASAGIWLVANELAGETHSRPFIAYWNAATRLAFFLLVALLLARLKDALAQAEQASRTDFLTGVLNGRAFGEAIAQEIRRVGRAGRPLSMAYVDLDDFKALNDHFGHSVGDTVLQAVAGILSARLRATDRVARLGGDEFAILLPETDQAAARVVVETLQKQLEGQMRQQGWPVTASIGVLTCPDARQTADELLKVVDNLMYEAKRSGKHTARYSICEKPGQNQFARRAP